MTDAAESSHLAAIPRTRAALEAGMLAGLHYGAQLAATIDGRSVVDLAIGEARPGVPLASDTLVLWLSATKPVVAAAAMQCVERGQLDLQTPVAEYLPPFAAGGKQHVTLWHLLTHTSGMPVVDIPWPQADWDGIVAAVCRTELAAPPGERAAYQPQATWFILGELVARAAGCPLPEVLRREIFLPLDMPNCWVGMPPDQFDAYGDRIALLPDTARASKPHTAGTPAAAPAPLHRFSSRQGATDCIPSGGGYGPMQELVHFYEMLLGGGQRQGVRILRPESVAAMTSRQRVGMFDETFRHKLDWGLGLIINSANYGPQTVPYGYGLHASPETFGHGGAQSSATFADPSRGLAVACYLHGTPGEGRHQKRMRELLTSLYEDLGLASN